MKLGDRIERTRERIGDSRIGLSVFAGLVAAGAIVLNSVLSGGNLSHALIFSAFFAPLIAIFTFAIYSGPRPSDREQSGFSADVARLASEHAYVRWLIPAALVMTIFSFFVVDSWVTRAFCVANLALFGWMSWTIHRAAENEAELKKTMSWTISARGEGGSRW